MHLYSCSSLILQVRRYLVLPYSRLGVADTNENFLGWEVMIMGGVGAELIVLVGLDGVGFGVDVESGVDSVGLVFC